MIEGLVGSDSTFWSSFKQAELDKIRLIDLLNRSLFFGECGCDGVEADGPAAKFLDHGLQDVPVGTVQTKVINAKHLQSLLHNLL